MTRAVGFNSAKPARATNLSPLGSEFAAGYSLSSNEAVREDGRVPPLEFAPRENCRGKAEMLLLLYRPFTRKRGGAAFIPNT